MATRESPASRGRRRSQFLRQRIAYELGESRRASGLSLRDVARRVGVSHTTVSRAERGDEATLSVDVAARLAAALGLELAASLYPAGGAIRDHAQLALLARLRGRLPKTITWRAEVPVPISGDRRSADAVITLPFGDVLVEAETRLYDIQLIERRAAAKARDLGAARILLVVSDTRHNRAVIREVAGLAERFPVTMRSCLRALAAGRDPGGDALVIL